MTKKENPGIRIIICVAVLGILLVAAVPILTIITEGLDSEFIFIESESIPENAVVIKLTEDDYEQYPTFRNIPQSFSVDASLISGFYIRPGCVDRETRDAILETYGAPNTYIEHNGTLYKIGLVPF